jgi:hypothetical protein
MLTLITAMACFDYFWNVSHLRTNTRPYQAWDTLTWFAALIAMAAYLNKFGFIAWFSSKVVGLVGGLGLSWQGAFGLITTLYFYSHYFFASGAAHIGAMYTAFLSVAIACGTLNRLVSPTTGTPSASPLTRLCIVHLARYAWTARRACPGAAQ